MTFLDDFQPLQLFRGSGVFGLLVTAVANYAAAFALAYTIGRGLKMGLGL